MPDELIAPSEACAMLGVTVATLARYADDGTLPCVKTPGGHRRYRRSDVEALLAGAVPEGTA